MEEQEKLDNVGLLTKPDAALGEALGSPKKPRKSVWKSLRKGLGLKKRKKKRGVSVTTGLSGLSRVPREAPPVLTEEEEQQRLLQIMALAQGRHNENLKQLQGIPEDEGVLGGKPSGRQPSMHETMQLVRQLTSPAIGMSDWLMAPTPKIHDLEPKWVFDPRKSKRFELSALDTTKERQNDEAKKKDDAYKRTMDLETKLTAARLTIEEQRKELAETRANRDELSRVADDVLNRLEEAGVENEKLQTELSEKKTIIAELESRAPEMKKQDMEIQRLRNSLHDIMASRDRTMQKLEDSQSQTEKLKKVLGGKNEEMFEKLASVNLQLHNEERMQNLEQALLVMQEKLVAAKIRGLQATTSPNPRVSGMIRTPTKTVLTPPYRRSSGSRESTPSRRTPTRKRSASGLASYGSSYKSFSDQVKTLEKAKQARRVGSSPGPSPGSSTGRKPRIVGSSPGASPSANLKGTWTRLSKMLDDAKTNNMITADEFNQLSRLATDRNTHLKELFLQSGPNNPGRFVRQCRLLL